MDWKQLIEDAAGDRKLAHAAAMEYLKDHPDEARKLLEESLSDVVARNLSRVQIRQRRAYFVGSAPKVRDLAQTITKIAVQNWHAMPLPNGKALGVCRGEDLTEAEQIYLQQIEGNNRRLEFLREVHSRLPEGKAVGEALTNEVLEGIGKRKAVELIAA